MFLYEAKQILKTYLLLRPCSPEKSKKVFSRSDFSNNFVQVLGSMHSNVQLLYLLLFFNVGVGVGVLVKLLKVPKISSSLSHTLWERPLLSRQIVCFLQINYRGFKSNIRLVCPSSDLGWFWKYKFLWHISKVLQVVTFYTVVKKPVWKNYFWFCCIWSLCHRRR